MRIKNVNECVKSGPIFLFLCSFDIDLSFQSNLHLSSFRSEPHCRFPIKLLNIVLNIDGFFFKVGVERRGGTPCLSSSPTTAGVAGIAGARTFGNSSVTPLTCPTHISVVINLFR